VDLADGRTLARSVEAVLGSPSRPLVADAMRAKFETCWLAAPELSLDRGAALWNAVAASIRSKMFVYLRHWPLHREAANPAGLAESALCDKSEWRKTRQNRDPVPRQPQAGALFNLSKRPRPRERADTIAERT
jgi:hypothetical protein